MARSYFPYRHLVVGCPVFWVICAIAWNSSLALQEPPARSSSATDGIRQDLGPGVFILGSQPAFASEDYVHCFRI